MHLSFAALLRQPTARRYQQLRRQLLAGNSGFDSTDSDLASDDFAGGDVDSQLTNCEHVLASLESCGHVSVGQSEVGYSAVDHDACHDLREAINGLLPSGLLSLKLHRLGGMVATLVSDDTRAALHRFTYDSLLQAIRATGVGTCVRPYVITYRSDAYELLAGGINIVSQSIVEASARRFDVLLTSDERELWFDVTDLLPATATAQIRRIRPTLQTSVRGKPRKAVSRSRR